MNARRDDLIRLAAETLGCVGQTAFGYWIYRETHTGLWMVSDYAMEMLAGFLGRWDSGMAQHAWNRESTAMEVDVALIVRDQCITSNTDLDDLESEFVTRDASVSESDIMAHLLLRFYRDDVVETVRINEEIDRDREPDDTRFDDMTAIDRAWEEKR
jgi:hypothetical protein